MTTRRVAFYDDPLFRRHDAGPGHPERSERLDAIRKGLRDAGLEPAVLLQRPRPATRDELLRVHTASHVTRVAGTEGKTERFDPDTQAGPDSYRAALAAAGAVVEATLRSLDGSSTRAFCAVRPPGHHAEAARAMGFCLFNNVAVAAAAALAAGARRAMIVDPDVHHGNGTQAIFYGDPRVLYVSSHAFPFYPGTGAIDEVGEGPGRGFTVNLPLPMGAGDAEYVAIYREIVEPIGRAFDPEVVLVSMGFDPFEEDPLAGMRVSAAGFGEIAASCLRCAGGAAQGRAVFALEGGYDLTGLATGAAAVVARLLGRETPAMSPAASPMSRRLVAAFREAHRGFWNVLS